MPCFAFSIQDVFRVFQAINEQLTAKKDDVAEAIRSTQVFLLSKQASK